MVVTSQIHRTLRTVSAVAVLWLLSVSISAAMPAPRASASKFCDAQTTSIRKLIRQARAVGGPLAKRLRPGIRLNRQATWVQQGSRIGVHDDDQAIQNDAPAAQLAADPRIDLRPLGVFVDAQSPPLFTRSLSPRSPRGPPVGA